MSKEKTALEVTLPNVYDSSLDIRKDGRLLFYKRDDDRVDGVKVYRHFYSVLNLNTQKLDQYELPYAPQFSFHDLKPVVDTERNRVIMPAYDHVPVKTSDTGESLFEYRVVFFNLDTFEIEQILSVRDFTTDQLNCYEGSCEEMASQFIAQEKGKKYTDAMRDFYENLSNIKVTPDGVWLCWRSGIIRRIDPGFKLSPLLVTSSMPRSEEGMFKNKFFHSKLYQIDDSMIILTDDSHFYRTSMPVIESVDWQTIIPLELEQVNLDEIYNRSYSKEKQEEVDLMGFIKIEVNDLSHKESIMHALDQIQEVVSDLEKAGVTSELSFIYKDAQGKSLQEPEFFAEAGAYAPEGIKSIVEQFARHPNAKYIYRHPEETALCHAVYELAKKGEDYLDTTLRYLAAIDLDHDVFNIENVFPLLDDMYKPKELRKKMKEISEDLEEWYADYKEQEG